MIKPLAIYLPQYHPIPENDVAWGEGFTEWTNVKKAKPLFEGHYQPHVPHEDVGYYDLRDPEVMVKQAEMAQKYGIYGFAFYYYWFNGKRLLNLPLDNMLKLGKPDFPFLYIWANEPWSRRWDGSENEVIQEQTYSFEDDLNHIRFLCENVFCDSRYIKIEGKPVFVVYRTELFPDIKKTVEIWRSEVKKYGFNDIYLIRVEHFVADIEPVSIGFDAAMEFAPNNKAAQDVQWYYLNSVCHYVNFNYNEIVVNAIIRNYKYKIFRSVFPSWDNSARKKNNIHLYSGSTPQVFSYFLYAAFEYTKKHLPEEENYIFINAWNEWGEGCHIEPDEQNGYMYLKTLSDVLNNQLKYQTEYVDFLKINLRTLIEKTKINREEIEIMKNKLCILQDIISSRRHKIVEKFYNVYRKIKSN